MPSRRQERVSERIHVDISELLQKRLRDPRLAHVTVTDVEITADLKLATVFISVMGDREAEKAALLGMERASGFIRRELAVSLEMRLTPSLRFELDRSWERGAHIDELLDSLPSLTPSEQDLGSEQQDREP
jgi:ribosome-binding factor A